MISLSLEAVREAETITSLGRIEEITGSLLIARGIQSAIGDHCRILDPEGRVVGNAKVIGFRNGGLVLTPLGPVEGIAHGFSVEGSGGPLRSPVGDALLGRVIDALGRPLDGRGPLNDMRRAPVESAVLPALERPRIREMLETGIRSIDAPLAIGKGQRIGIFAGSGVGKSSVLASLARNTNADVNVIALVGERGREVNEFLEDALGPEGLARSVVVVTTSEEPAVLKVQAATYACRLAEHFRSGKRDVVLMVDSITRVAMAQREIGLAAGEPPTSRGYTPSVFALLPRLIERAGTSQEGSITGIYSVLVEGDDMDEPVSDHLRSVLDGHVVLSRKLAMRNHYPAVDILASTSRVMADIVTDRHAHLASTLRNHMARFAEVEDLVAIGAYRPGGSPEVDRAVELDAPIRAFLTESGPSSFEDSLDTLERLFGTPETSS